MTASARLPSRITSLVAAMFCLSALLSPPANARNDRLDDINLHRIADMASPRDTLRSFIDLSEELIETWQPDGASDRVYVLFKGLQETMDFSATDNGAEPYVQIRRVLLREVLDRLVLPPWNEIPGPAAVAQGVDVWAIPGTRLRIGRIGEGRRAGEFVFTAGTVEDLHLTYNRVRRQPYQPGALPFLDRWEASGAGAFAVTKAQLEGRLSVIDTSSPSSVLSRFLRHVNVAYRIATEAERKFSASPPEMSIDEVRAAEEIATAEILRASTAFDMSRVPDSQREDVRIEATLMLKEVLDRVVLPPIHEIPDTSAVNRAGSDTSPFVWRFPGLPIAIARVLDGDRAGSFAFDPRTLESLEETYGRLKGLPYKKRLPLRGEWEYGGDDAISPGFYDFYISTPGRLIPSASLLGRIVTALPSWSKTVYGAQTVWQWIGFGLSLAIALVAGYTIQLVASRMARARSDLAAAWILVLPPLAVIVLFVSMGRFVDQELNITGDALQRFVIVNQLIVLVLVATLIWRAFMAIAASVAATRRLSERGVDASLVHMLCGIAALAVGAAAVVGGLRDMGVDAVPLIAGLGIGGIAIALAIRPTLENLIGSLILYSDRPVRIGDYCTVGGMTGTIESIGVRSTQIRGLDRTLISIPNSRFADMDIVNWAHCDRMLIDAVLGLRYETTPDQLRYLLVSIRRMLHGHPMIDRHTVRVRYAGPAASSRDVKVRIYVLTHDWNEFHAVREDVFLRIDDLVEAAGVGYAFPSQTLYLTQDQQPDAERQAAAQAEVAAWRAANEMPFPRLARNTMDELEGTLDYPPRGSNRSVHGRADPEMVPEPLSADGAPTDASRD